MECGFAIGCSNCGFEKHLKTGTGVRPRKIDSARFSLVSGLIESGRERRKTVTLLENPLTFVDDFGYAVFSCPGCGELSSHFRFRVRRLLLPGFGGAGEGRVLFRAGFSCPRCQIRLRRVKTDRGGEPVLNLENRSCPGCGQKTLEYRGVVLWD